MTLSRHIALGSAAVIGLMFLAGTGCGPKNDSDKLMAQVMARDLAKEREIREIAAARAKCLEGLTSINNELDREKKRNECLSTHSAF